MRLTAERIREAFNYDDLAKKHFGEHARLNLQEAA